MLIPPSYCTASYSNANYSNTYSTIAISGVTYREDFGMNMW